jgi:hypothetical protein
MKTKLFQLKSGLAEVVTAKILFSASQTEHPTFPTNKTLSYFIIRKQ